MVEGDKLVVGYRDAMKHMSQVMSAVCEHRCDDQNGVSYATMAKALWNAGYRFDTEARKQWLIVELRSSLDGSLSEMFAELLKLTGEEG